MKAFILASATGAELRAVETPSADYLDETLEGQQWVEVPLPVREWTVELVDGELVPVPRPVNPAKALEVAKAAKAAQVLEGRRGFEQSPITLGEQTYLADEASRTMLANSLVLAREFEEAYPEQAFSTIWKLADGSTATLTRANLRDLALALGARVQQAFAAEAALRSQIQSAATLEAVAAIQWQPPSQE